ncbi:MAG: hypothetical protein R3E82_18260 [Pseudomonadales bacterium]|nr:hypothetical protein [Pseudomonadales bacterium]
MNGSSPAADLIRLLSGALSALNGPLGTIGNRTLALDPRSRARLAALDTAVVQFEIVPPADGPDTLVVLEIENATISFHTSGRAAPNAIVRGTLPAMIGWLASGTGTAPAGITFEGDENLLRNLAAVVRSYRPDLEEPLGRLLGPAATRELLGAAETTVNFLRSALSSLSGAATASAQATARAGFVAEPDMPEMLDTLDALQLRVDRLNARVRELEGRLPQPSAETAGE